MFFSFPISVVAQVGQASAAALITPASISKLQIQKLAIMHYIHWRSYSMISNAGELGVSWNKEQGGPDRLL